MPTHPAPLLAALERLRDARRREAEARLAEVDALAEIVTAAGGAGVREEYLSTKELADRLPYTEGTLRNLAAAGKFVKGEDYFKKGRRTIWRWSAVERRLAQPDRADVAAEVVPFTEQKVRRGRSG